MNTLSYKTRSVKKEDLNRQWYVVDADGDCLLYTSDILDSRHYVIQGITPEIALLATEMSIDTKDPADKLIAATSIVLGLPLISADQFMRNSTEVRTIW